MSVVNVLDVAVYILKEKGKMTTMKLQKLVYYCQAWSLVWDETPLFEEKIYAWSNGPVVRELYDAHKGMFNITFSELSYAHPENIDSTQKETIDAVLEFYGNHSSQWLSDLTHMEDPWKNARKGIPENQRSEIEITHAAMAEYYESLTTDEES